MGVMLIVVRMTVVCGNFLKTKKDYPERFANKCWDLTKGCKTSSGVSNDKNQGLRVS